jgi:hypothetical protein
MASSDRGYSAGYVAIELEGRHAGTVRSAEGGDAYAEVVAEPPVGSRVPKHIANLGYSPIVVTVGPEMDGEIYDWVIDLLDGKQTYKDGAIVLLDYDGREKSRLDWDHAVISEVVFPALDTSEQDRVEIRISIEPERVSRTAGNGAIRSLTSMQKNTSYRTNQFRFSISGLESATSKVRSIEEIVVRRRKAEQADERREYETSSTLELSDVAFTVGDPDAAAVMEWFDNFVIKGRSEDSFERTATLALLDMQSRTDLLRIELDGVGPFRMTRQRHVSGQAATATTRIEMYCERVSLPPRPGTAQPIPERIPTSFPPSPIPADAPDEVIADRLAGSGTASEPSDDSARGRELGRKWAAGYAQLEELREIAALAERDDWTALALPEGHSLIDFLVGADVLAASRAGVTDLARDRLVEGIVAGAAEIYRRVEPQVEGIRRPPRS